MRSSTTSLLLVLAGLTVGCGKPITNGSEDVVAKDPYSRPKEVGTVELLGVMMVANFNELPLQGEIHDQGRYWSGDYWQHNRGSINRRWYTAVPVGFDTVSPGRDAVASMGLEALKELAPSEKYDLLMGRYDYPLKKEVTRLARRTAKDWEGLCHGWAPATLNHREPEPKTLTNPHGIEIPFGSSDIKALLTYYYAYHSGGKSSQIGKRCYKDAPAAGTELQQETDQCNDDLDPGLFHIVLANKVGLKGESFLADMDRYREVWNHPIVTFTSKVLSESVNRKKVRTLTVNTQLYYVDEKEENFWTPTIGTSEHVTTHKSYDYQLDVDADGKILRGRWISADRPDFVWSLKRPERFEGYFLRIEDLLTE